MDFIKIRFGGDFEDMSSKIEKTIEGFFRPRALNPTFDCSECAWKPPMDIFETREQIVIIAEIAGVDKEDLDVEINNRAVKIHGKRLGIPPESAATYRLAEIQYGTFERILYLPAPIDSNNVTASFSNGFLKIRLSKMPLDKTHKIAISDG
ncbi:MAG: Hsp20/alpha crystallin family protein [Deltaproteobacteria bacterium]|nr:Hsp20/alpha crystallin family protein [Deltaproteobacteria bacterium]